ncbi:MAG: DUF3987 domain-containing protein [Microcoleaceae cyanobacterium]
MNDFNILDWLDRLTPAQERNKYYCPVCSGNDLSISPTTGEYSCFHGCDRRDIREAIRPWSEVVAEQERSTKKPRTQTEPIDYVYRDRQGNPLIRVVKLYIKDGTDKKIWQEHWNGQTWVSGYGSVKREGIPIYRYAEVMEAIAQGKTIIHAEGEGVVDDLWSKGIPAFCTIGGTGKTVSKTKNGIKPFYEGLEHLKPALLDLGNTPIIQAPDRDQPGVLHMEMTAKLLNVVGWLYAFPDSKVWQNLPIKHGLDLSDWIADFKPTTEQILELVKPEPIHQLQPSKNSEQEVGRITPEQVIQEIDIELKELALNRGELSESQIYSKFRELEVRYPNIARGYGLQRQYQALCQELDAEQILERDHNDFKRLHEYQLVVSNFDWSTVYPPLIWQALSSKAEVARIPIEFVIQPYVSTCSIFCGSKLGAIAQPGERIQRKDGTVIYKGGWVEYSVLWTVIINDPSSGKSVGRDCILDPIEEFQDVEHQKYEVLLQRYETIQEHWALMSSSEKRNYVEDEETNLRLWSQKYLIPPRQYNMAEDSTLASIKQRIAEQPIFSGVGLLEDELMGIFKGIDRYIISGGAGRQWILDAWKGPLKSGVGRKQHQDSFRFNQQVVIIGGNLQPTPARTLLDPKGEYDDPDGLASRLLLSYPNRHSKYVEWSDASVNIYQLIYQVYEILNALPNERYLIQLSPSSKQQFIGFWMACRKSVMNYSELNPAFAAFLGKAPGHCLRLAVHHLSQWLVCEIVQEGQVGQEELAGDLSRLDQELTQRLANLQDQGLPPEVMNKAIYHTQYYIASFRVVQFKLCEQITPDTPLSIPQKIIHEFLKARPNKSYNPSILKNSIRALRKMTTQQVNLMCRNLTELGLVSRIDKKYSFLSDTPLYKSLAENLDEFETHQSPNQREIEGEKMQNLDNLDTDVYFFTPTDSSKKISTLSKLSKNGQKSASNFYPEVDQDVSILSKKCLKNLDTPIERSPPEIPQLAINAVLLDPLGNIHEIVTINSSGFISRRGSCIKPEDLQQGKYRFPTSQEIENLLRYKISEPAKAWFIRHYKG